VFQVKRKNENNKNKKKLPTSEGERERERESIFTRTPMQLLIRYSYSTKPVRCRPVVCDECNDISG